MAATADATFLNVPYGGAKNERKLIALVAGVVALGRKPRCALEVADGGQGSLRRIGDLLARCETSIHDLSETGVFGPRPRVPRFNMPFELGIAYRLSREQPHRFYVFEAVPHRLQRSLSDINGIDPQIHNDNADDVLLALANCLGRRDRAVTVPEMRALRTELARLAKSIKTDLKTDDLFGTAAYRLLVAGAISLAKARHLLA